MAADEILVPALSAAGGALTTGWIARQLIQNWLKKHDAMEGKVGDMIVQLTRIEERVTTLQRTEERTRMQDRDIAVMQQQLAEFREDMNGIGRKVRGMEQQ